MIGSGSTRSGGRSAYGQTVAEVGHDLLADLAPDERRQFRALLRRVVDGMSDRPVPGSCL
ncbi:hypothetical protein [Nocardiopsis sp. NRRL B-16309]|uniref:hypothetical protein n=1 Tax=Nocardiopsis sp. NRRL B-16309 TaxID=1519494 RepID=UPI0006ADD395|nr:hypothetical protein [Nocardiopsis sp. NRRL B-16309]KOX14040.1 hypothetical protein ADL05_17570 [Nocardiopsis sp. NRRL B-16309]